MQGGPKGCAPPTQNLAPLLNETSPPFILSQDDFWSYSSIHSSAFELRERERNVVFFFPQVTDPSCVMTFQTD